ncbi:putative GTP pyrophosphokinase [Mobilisporobacter senegalensis]|uniref:Putative GTP pyrophosphokinase n=1 Tax=Mobilisporobacter senegalensis TaxID=1329262 RepID=A0A3N1XA91_9FIRM|nr:putative GTP pyrophosphokinase [Mobilisporobacter senegalensis]
MELPIFYDEAEEWKNALLLYDSALKEINTKIEIMNNEFKLTHQYNPIEHVVSRLKSPESIAKKIRHNKKELTVENIVKYVNDVAGVRIICSFTSDIYRIADLIAKQSDVKVLKVKDYITCPKENGYSSYHMIVSVPIYLSNNVIETKVEIQIRTIAMDFWASLEHKIYYKFEGNAPERIRKELRECSEIVSYLDHKMLSLNEEIKSFSHDREAEYKDILSENFRDMIKESYGTVIDEDAEEEVIKLTEETQINEEIALDKPKKQKRSVLEYSKQQANLIRQKKERTKIFGKLI